MAERFRCLALLRQICIAAATFGPIAEQSIRRTRLEGYLIRKAFTILLKNLIARDSHVWKLNHDKSNTEVSANSLHLYAHVGLLLLRRLLYYWLIAFLTIGLVYFTIVDQGISMPLYARGGMMLVAICASLILMISLRRVTVNMRKPLSVLQKFLLWTFAYVWRHLMNNCRLIGSVLQM